MPRPQGVQFDNFVDAAIGARSGLTIQRSFTLADLPRVRQAGARDGSHVTASFHFLQFDGRIAIDGHLDGVVKLVCQRCMRDVELPLHDQFQLILVQDEAELSEEIAGYEPITGDPARLDLQLLTEDQTLLALPLVPVHESEDCNKVAVDAATAADDTRQTPFANLRDLLRKQ
ncbi:MAG TPA: YceD family protein [Steroidobacteraceae bacterium]|jgi:uncharacterized protein